MRARPTGDALAPATFLPVEPRTICHVSRARRRNPRTAHLATPGTPSAHVSRSSCGRHVMAPKADRDRPRPRNGTEACPDDRPGLRDCLGCVNRAEATHAARNSRGTQATLQHPVMPKSSSPRPPRSYPKRSRRAPTKSKPERGTHKLSNSPRSRDSAQIRRAEAGTPFSKDEIAE